MPHSFHYIQLRFVDVDIVPRTKASIQPHAGLIRPSALWLGKRASKAKHLPKVSLHLLTSSNAQCLLRNSFTHSAHSLILGSDLSHGRPTYFDSEIFSTLDAMSHFLNQDFNDSESDDEEFNPAPENASDDEAGNHSNAARSRKASRPADSGSRKVRLADSEDDDDDEGEVARNGGVNGDADEAGDDAEEDGDGEDDKGGDEDDEEDEDEEEDEEEEVTVCCKEFVARSYADYLGSPT